MRRYRRILKVSGNARITNASIRVKLNSERSAVDRSRPGNYSCLVMYAKERTVD